MRPIAPRTGAPEIHVGEGQDYRQITAAVYQQPSYGDAISLLMRYTMTPDERARVAAGEDIYVMLLTLGHPMQPIAVQVGPDGYLVEDPG